MFDRAFPIGEPLNGDILMQISFERKHYSDNCKLQYPENIPGLDIELIVKALTQIQLGVSLPTVVDRFFPSWGLLWLRSMPAEDGDPLGDYDVKKNLQDVVCGKSSLLEFLCDMASITQHDTHCDDGAYGCCKFTPNDATANNIAVLTARTVAHFENEGGLAFQEYERQFDSKYIKECNKQHKIMKAKEGNLIKLDMLEKATFFTKDTVWMVRTVRRPLDYGYMAAFENWVLGQHFQADMYKDITKVGVFYPCTNTAETFRVSKIPQKLIEMIERAVYLRE